MRNLDALWILSECAKSIAKLGLSFPNINEVESEFEQTWVNEWSLRLATFGWVTFMPQCFVPRSWLKIANIVPLHWCSCMIAKSCHQRKPQLAKFGCNNSCFNYLVVCVTYIYSTAIASNFIPVVPNVLYSAVHSHPRYLHHQSLHSWPNFH